MSEQLTSVFGLFFRVEIVHMKAARQQTKKLNENNKNAFTLTQYEIKVTWSDAVYFALVLISVLHVTDLKIDYVNEIL